AFLLWLTVVLCLPLFTIATIGFLSYGLTIFLAVFCFVCSFCRLRVRVLCIGLVLLYVGLSFYVTYTRDRTAIRDTVWGGAPVSSRLERLYRTVSDIEWFNIHEPDHLQRIDGRMNQNWLVGTAVHYLASGATDFGYGETLWMAVIALVPRIIWPDKP